MNKQRLTRFIQKYYLNGTVNSIVLRSSSDNLSARFISGDKNLSPVIDTMNSSISYIRNRLNNPIDNYATDSRVNLNSNDPNWILVETNI